MKYLLNARERACIALRIPKSGTKWLDELISEAQLRDLTVQIQQSQASVVLYELTHGVDIKSEIAKGMNADLVEESTYGISEYAARAVLNVVRKSLSRVSDRSGTPEPVSGEE